MHSATLILAERAHRLLLEKNLTVAAAESCTGGYLSHLLTLLPGSSAFFLAGAVVYSAGAKEKLIGVAPDLIAECGTVGPATARAMAIAVARTTGAVLGVATTGNIGPEAIENKDVGLVYIAVNRGNESVVRELRLHGDRDQNKEAAAAAALLLLIEVLEQP